MVETDRIILDSKRFKISPDIPDESLEISLVKHGFLGEVNLLEDGNGFVPITGHNKLKVLERRGLLPERINARVFSEVTFNMFYDRLRLKLLRDEVGPIGRISALHIIGKEFSPERRDLEKIAREVLSVPEFIINKTECLLNLPVKLSDYLDSRKVPYKLIRDILVLSPELVNSLSVFVSGCQVKINIFKKIIELLFDLSGSDCEGSCAEILRDSTTGDVETYSAIYLLRYPCYSEQKKSADELISALSVNGITVEFPEYFERDRFFLKIPVSGKDKDKNISERLNGVHMGLVLKLKDML